MNLEKRLQILKNSLVKKESRLDSLFNKHFDAVKATNGQPLNDKKNGAATMARWERQNDAIRAMQDSIKLTKEAIEKEQYRVNDCDSILNDLPQCIIELLETGVLTQWKKNPEFFFVDGVNTARIIYRLETKTLAHKYVSQIRDNEQFQKFRDVFNSLNAILGNKQK